MSHRYTIHPCARMLDQAEALEISGSGVLLSRCRDGHEDAWRQLFSAHFPFVYRTARRLGAPVEELDDVCQEVFLVVFRKLANFKDGRFSTWLYRITANVVFDRHRRRRVRAILFQLFSSEKLHAAASPITPTGELEQREAEQLVGRVLERMAPKKREVFVLYELEHLPGEQIAELVGCKLETVWTRLHHARKDFARIARKLGVDVGQ